MMFNYRYFNLCTFVFVTAFVSLSNAAFCSNLTSIDEKDKPCFLEPPSFNPSRLRSAGNNLVLPCHVARSKRSTIEWWYQDFQKSINIKIYPVFPAVRPTVLRFITSITPISKHTNETDIIDVSILLRNVNVDDSGIYRCVIRPWSPGHMANIDEVPAQDDPKSPSLIYHVELTGPRICQMSLGNLPCFSNMRTSSPTTLDAYQVTFLQCVVHNHNRPVNVFWVVGNASANSVLITDYLATNQHNGDRLRRIFPLSPFDYSIELTVNHDTRERAYSCVIDGATDAETTLFTYIVRSIDPEDSLDKTIKVEKTETAIEKKTETENTTTTTTTTTVTTTTEPTKIVAHDALTSDQVEELRKKTSQEAEKTKLEKSDDMDDDDLLEFSRRKETTEKN